MRSTLSNPVEAGIDSFSKLMGTFNSMEDSKQRRELMAQNEADRRIENEWKQKEHAETEKRWTKEHEQEHGTDMLNIMAGVKQKYEDSKASGQPFDVTKLDDKEHDAIHYAQGLHGTSSSDLGDLLDFIQTAGQQVQGKKGQIPLDERKAKTLTSALQISPDKLNTDDYGNKVEGRLVGAAVDGTSPDMPTGLMVERTLKPGVYKHISDDKNEVYVAPDSNPQGIEQKGNINLNARPVVLREDGKMSNMISMSIEKDGKEILIPSVSQDGKILSSKEAVAAWEKTITKDKPFGDHLGVFKDVESANAYAQDLHNSKLWKKDNDYYSQRTHKDLLKMGDGADPNAPYNIHPAQLLVSKFNLQKEFADMYDQIEAKSHPEEFRKKREAAQLKIAQSKGVKEAVKAWQEDQNKNPGQTVSEMRLSLIAKLPDSMDDTKKSAYAKDIIPEKSDSEKLPTKASLYAEAAGGNKTSEKALNMMTKDEIKVHQAGKSAEGREKSTIAEVDKLDGVIIKKYRQGDKNVESTEDLDISDESKAELQDKKDKAIKLIKGGKSATEAWNEVDKKRTKDPEKPKPAKKLDRTIVEKIRGKNKEVKDDDPEVAKVTAGVVSAKEAVKKLVDAGFNEQHSIDYVKRNSKKAK